ncbi:hypothetical protein [Brevibacterium album]|uniref:hypothetical protein n=1 Tax=Brevibacterium album TaxID=417948 RepID=UPI00048D3CA2|nr:hypothetical protein [Brevibacterium album]
MADERRLFEALYYAGMLDRIEYAVIVNGEVVTASKVEASALAIANAYADEHEDVSIVPFVQAKAVEIKGEALPIM